MKRVKNILFDWSGVLSNDLTSVYEATMVVFEQLGGERISLVEFRREFVLPYMKFWHKYFPDLKKEEGDKLFLEAFNRVKQLKPYPGAKEVLEKIIPMVD